MKEKIKSSIFITIIILLYIFYISSINVLARPIDGENMKDFLNYSESNHRVMFIATATPRITRNPEKKYITSSIVMPYPYPTSEPLPYP